MTTLAVLVLVVAAAASVYDYVESPFSLEREVVQDRLILRCFGIATLVLLAYAPVAGLVLGLGVLGYWREGHVRFLVLTAALAATWCLAPLVAPYERLIAAAWVLGALLEGAFMIWHWGAMGRWWRGRLRAQRLPFTGLAGVHGQYTFFAAGVALVLPFAWWLGGPWLGLPVLGLLVAISSWVGLAAGAAALGVLYPVLLPWGPAAAGLAFCLLLPRLRWDRASVWDRLARGDSLDSVRLRWRTWVLLVGLMQRFSWRDWGRGRGWMAVNDDLLRAFALDRLRGAQGTAHQEAIELVYSSGGLGLVFLGALGWAVCPQLQVADPWSAGVVAGVVVGLGSHALRYPAVGVPWWISCAIVAGRAGG